MSELQPTPTKRKFEFFRAGGLDQVMIRTGADIGNLATLPQELWVGLSVPVRGVEFDPKTLDLIDTDDDGRIRASELLGAIRWTLARIKNPDDLLRRSGELPVAAISDQDEAGKQLVAGAKRILANLGKPDAAVITLADTGDTHRIFVSTRFNGDGVVPVAAADDPELSRVIEEIIACLGAETDRSGLPGVNLPKVERFFTELEAFVNWSREGAASPSILPLADATSGAADLVKKLRAKIDDYFTRCRLAAFDLRAADLLNRAVEDYRQIVPQDLSTRSEEVARLPIATIAPGKPFPLEEPLNPAWASLVERFRKEVVTPVFGVEKRALMESDWAQILAKFGPFDAWQGRKPAGSVEKLGLERAAAILATDSRARIRTLIEQDLALEAENARIKEVDQLIRFYRDIVRLIENFVNLRDFYAPDRTAIFQIGRLYMDARVCDLCFHVDDIVKHSTLSTPSKIYLAYCEAVRPATKEKRSLCAAFTAGFAETLWVGRNGLFYDRDGKDWDAVIVKVVENQISLREAFWMPWKKLATMLADQIKKIMASKEAATVSAASKHLDEMGKKVEAPKAPAVPAPAAPAKMEGAALASSIAAIGIAVGFLSQAVAKIFDATRSIEAWQIVLAVVAIILSVSGPSVVIASFRLRARDVAPLLNASGWAVNSRIRMTFRLGRELTREAKLPPGSDRRLRDPYAEDNSTRDAIILVLIVAAIVYALWKFDFLGPVLNRPSDGPQGPAPAAPAIVVP